MKNTLAKNAFFNVLYRILNVIFPLISAAYISRVLAPEGIGKAAYAQNVASYFVMFAALGIPQYGTREIARRQNDPADARKLFSELLLINFFSTTVCAAAYYVFICAAFPGNVLIYAVFGLELVFNYINIDWLYQGKEEYVYIAVRSILVKFLSLLMLVLFVKEPQDYVIYGLITCMGIGCNYVFNALHARALIRPVFKGLELRRHLKPILILMLSSVAASLYSKVDITMLGWLSTDEAVGYYSNAHKIVNTILTLVTAISAVFLPRLSYIYEKEREKYGKYLSLGLKIVLLLSLPCCVGLILVADALVVTLFGELFAPAAAAVRILAVLILVKGVGDLLCYQAIISSGNEKQLVRSRVVAGVVNILLNSVLIPRFAHTGAALASVISELIVNGMLIGYSLAIERPKLQRRFLASVLAGTMVMAAAVLLLQSCFRDPLTSLLLSAGAGAAVYFVFVAILKNDLVLTAVCALRGRKR